jgi:hypothetical protein
MTKAQVRKAFQICDAAFQRYIREAVETHRLLSVLSESVALDQRICVMEQRIRENDAQMAYMDSRNALFDVLTIPTEPRKNALGKRRS